MAARAARIAGAWATGLWLACAGRAEPAAVPPDPAAFPHDPALFAVLVMEPGPAQMDALDAYEAQRGVVMSDTLEAIAEDPDRHGLLRANALLLFGRREPGRSVLLLGTALGDPDERLQLAAVGVLREILEVQPALALRLLDRALTLPSRSVQARVLETVADRDVVMLRAFVRRGPDAALLRIAIDLIAVAEERGAALEPADSTAVLQRTGPAGHTLRYVPEQHWADGVSAGALTVRAAGAAAIALGTVEVAGSVVPAFFSADGRFLVWESERSIRVRDLSSGAVREIGPGIAPRVLPFTEDFVYLREAADGRSDLRGATRIRYALLRAPFRALPGDSLGPAVIASLSATARTALHGNASPVRWMRVTEVGAGRFALAGESMDTTLLPDPFTAGSSHD